MAVNPSIVQLTPDCGLCGGGYGAEAVILSGPIDALIDLSTSLDVHFIPPKANEDTPTRMGKIALFGLPPHGKPHGIPLAADQ